MKFKRTRLFVAVPLLLLATLLAGCGDDKPEALIASAKEYLAKNDYKAAAIQMKNALQKQPDLAEARYLLGLALLNSGDPVNAEIELRKASDLKHPADVVTPQLARAVFLQGKFKKVTDDFGKTVLAVPSASAELQTTLANAYAAQGDRKAFQTSLDAALAADPENVAASLVQIRQKVAAKDVDGGAAQLEALIVKHPREVEAWKLKGDLLLYAKNQPTEALDAYRKSVEIKPDYLPGHLGVVTMLLRLGNLPEAEKEMAALKKVAPNHPQTRYLETQIAFTKKDFKQARELAQQLLKATPNNPRSLEIAGGIELQLNSLVTAEDYLSKAVQTAPELGLARRWLVVTYLRSGQAAKAKTTLSPVIDAKTTDGGLLSLAGQVELQNGDVKKAEEYFAKASKLDPQDPRKRTTLAVTHLADANNAESAFGELQDIAASDKGTTADMALISAFLRRKEFDKALTAIAGLEKKEPGNPRAAYLRGRTQLAMNDAAAARGSFEAALTVNPTYFPAVASLAAIDMADKKPAEARKRFEAVLTKEPKNGQALLALAELRAREGGTKDEVADLIGKAVAANPTEVGPRLLLVDLYLRQKDVKQASSAAQNALAAMPDKPELLDAVGRTQLASGDFNQAVTTFSKVAALQPQSPAPLLRLADANMGAKNSSAAEQALNKALELRPDLLEAQLRLASLKVATGKFPEALAVARSVQKQRPKEPAGYLIEGDVRLAQKSPAEAAIAYQSGLKQVSSPELAIKAYASLAAAGKSAEADKFASAWMKDKPKDTAMLMYLGDAALARKDFALSEKHYLNVVQIQPQNSIAYNNLAWITAQLNKEGAIAYAEKANSLAPDQPAFMDTLAMLLADKQDFKKAIELQTKVLGLQAENPLFKFNMAKIYAKAGEKDSAKKQLDDLAKLGDKFSGQAEVAKLRATL